MQFMPNTMKDYPHDPFNPEQSIEAGAKYIKWLLNRYDGDWKQAMAAYNWGTGNLGLGTVADQRMRILPEETSTYVRRIEGYMGESPTQVASIPPQRSALGNASTAIAEASMARDARREAIAIADMSFDLPSPPAPSGDTVIVPPSPNANPDGSLSAGRLVASG